MWSRGLLRAVLSITLFFGLSEPRANEAILLHWPPVRSTISPGSLAAGGLRCEFVHLDPAMDYAFEGEWSVSQWNNGTGVGGGKLEFEHLNPQHWGMRRWPLSLSFEVVANAGPAPPSARHVVEIPVEETHEGGTVTATLRLLRHLSGHVKGKIERVMEFHLVRDGHGGEGEVRSETVIASWPPEGSDITSEALEMAGYTALLLGLHKSRAYRVELRVGDHVMDQETVGGNSSDEGGRGESIEYYADVPLLPEGDHQATIKVFHLDRVYGEVLAVEHNHLLQVRKGGGDQPWTVIGEEQDIGDGVGWVRDSEWCGKSREHNVTCSPKGLRAVHSALPDTLLGAEGSCDVLVERGIRRILFWGDSYVRGAFQGLAMVLSGDYELGSIKQDRPGETEQRAACRGEEQFAKSCRENILTAIDVCGGMVTLKLWFLYTEKHEVCPRGQGLWGGTSVH